GLEDLTVSDNGVKQKLNSFRLVRGSEAITASGTATKLDPLRQVRLVTLTFEAMGEADQRKNARTAALDLIKSDAGPNVFYSVVAINTQLYVLQRFTKDKDLLAQAIESATGGLGAPRLGSDSDRIKQELRKNLNELNVNGANDERTLVEAAVQAAGQDV